MNRKCENVTPCRSRSFVDGVVVEKRSQLISSRSETPLLKARGKGKAPQLPSMQAASMSRNNAHHNESLDDDDVEDGAHHMVVEKDGSIVKDFRSFQTNSVIFWLISSIF